MLHPTNELQRPFLRTVADDIEEGDPDVEPVVMHFPRPFAEAERMVPGLREDFDAAAAAVLADQDVAGVPALITAAKGLVAVSLGIETFPLRAAITALQVSVADSDAGTLSARVARLVEAVDHIQLLFANAAHLPLSLVPQAGKCAPRRVLLN